LKTISASECIEFLRRFDHINPSLEKKLKAMTGLRNILVHEYVVVDVQRLFQLLDNIDDLSDFCESVKDL